MKKQLEMQLTQSNQTLGRRLLLAFAAVLSVLMVWSVVMIVLLTNTHRDARRSAQDELPTLSDFHEVLALTAEIERLVLAHVLATDPSSKQRYDAEIQKRFEQVNAKYKEVQSDISSATEETLFRQVESARTEYVERRNRVLEMSRAGRSEEALRLNATEVGPAFEAYWKALRAFGDETEEALHRAVAHTQANALRGITITVAGSLVAVVVAGLVGWYTHRRLEQVLNPVVESLRQGCEQVASAAGQITSTSQSVAQGASEQAASLQETSASLEELTAMTQRNAANAQQARQLATQTRSAV
ncbi:MAG: MCP four helix bundle domain-containing protein, partial [Limisphaera sp.]|nr:MCP four helix bundle domain-containing protein [Limisphaera sp.]